MTSLIVFAVIFVIGFVVWILFRNNAEVLGVLFKDRSTRDQSRASEENWSSNTRSTNVPYSAPPAQSAPPRVTTEPRAPGSPAPRSAAVEVQSSRAQSVRRPQPEEPFSRPSQSAKPDSGVRDAQSGRAQSIDRGSRRASSDDVYDGLLSPPRVFRRRGVGGGDELSNDRWAPSPNASRGAASARIGSENVEAIFQRHSPEPEIPRAEKLSKREEAKQAKTKPERVTNKQKKTLLSKISGKEGHSVARKAAAKSVSHAIRDAVDCSVFSPPAVPPRETFLVQAFVHRPEQSETVQSLAKEFDSDAAMRGFKSLGMEIERGSKISLHLSMAGLSVDEPVQDIVWQGAPEAVQFAVTVPASQAAGNIIGTVTASLNGVPLGHIKFKLTIKSGVRADEFKKMKPSGISARHYQKAFISYASVDRTEVLKRVQMLKNLGIEFFQDMLDLEPGARWEKKLYRHIDDCDLFLLFWSSSASQSGWVLKEVEYALQRKSNEMDPPEIMPIPIEGPPPVPPPDNLKHLHFNDYFLYFMR